MKKAISGIIITLTLLASAAAQAATGAATSATTPSSSAPAATAAAVTKDETVFALLDPSGRLEEVTVSDWLHSDRPDVLVRDRSDLTDIENVKGKDGPRASGSDLLWQLSGKDLYYRGQSRKALPLAFTITYSLDGKPMAPADLVGKAGLVRVRVEARNLARTEVTIDGKKRILYTPMLVVIGANLPAATFRDIEITGGRLVTDGKNNIVAGVLLPGLAESVVAAGGSDLDLASLGIKGVVLPEVFEFSARTDSFKLGSIMIGASPVTTGLGGDDAAKGLDDALAKIAMLGDASGQIRQGSAALADGAAQLSSGIAQAAGSLRPLLAAHRDDLATLSAFLSDDANIAAARDLLAAARELGPVMPGLLDLAKTALDSKNRALIEKTLADARGLDTKDLLGSPLVSGLLDKDNLKAMSESLAASDELYRGMDEKRLRAAGDLAAGSGQLFTVLARYDETAAAYDPATGEALARFASTKALQDEVASGCAALGDWDAAAAATALSNLDSANASFMKATASLADEGATQRLLAKLASGAALDSGERAALAGLVNAAGAERGAIAAAAGGTTATPGARPAANALVVAARALPLLPKAATASRAAGEAAGAAATLSRAVLPGLAAARDARSQSEAAIASAKTVLDPKTSKSLAVTVSHILEVKASYEKSRFSFDLARSGLALMAKDGGLKAQLGKLAALQQDLKGLEPLLDKGMGLLDAQDASGKKLDLDALSVRMARLPDELGRIEPLLPVGERLLAPEGVAEARGLVSKLPELEAGLGSLQDGSALLAEKLGELAAGAKRFDEEGVQQLVGLASRFGKLARSFVTTKDELSALSRNYRIFTCAPADMKTRLKFVLRTEELR
jgi:putative membrane protein